MIFGELKRHGTFEIGTFVGLDGEVIGLDGKFYRIRADGIAYPVPDSVTAPFAVVIPFEADKTVSVQDITDYEALQRTVEGLIPDKTIFYAIKIDGTFSYIKARGVPKQKEPYPPLVEAVKDQTVFEFHDVKGTIVVFWCPDSAKGVNVPDYHLHLSQQAERPEVTSSRVASSRQPLILTTPRHCIWYCSSTMTQLPSPSAPRTAVPNCT
jgi:acetolactate decarboxylase